MDSFLESFAIFIAGIIAPSKFPKCRVPVLCTPVRILAISGKIYFFVKVYFYFGTSFE